MDQHLLSIVLWTPIAGLLVLLFLPSGNKNAIRIWANLASFLGFLVSLPLVFRFESGAAGFQYVERAEWALPWARTTTSESTASACCSSCSPL